VGEKGRGEKANQINYYHFFYQFVRALKRRGSGQGGGKRGRKGMEGENSSLKPSSKSYIERQPSEGQVGREVEKRGGGERFASNASYTDTNTSILSCCEEKREKSGKGREGGNHAIPHSRCFRVQQLDHLDTRLVAEEKSGKVRKEQKERGGGRGGGEEP